MLYLCPTRIEKRCFLSALAETCRCRLVCCSVLLICLVGVAQADETSPHRFLLLGLQPRYDLGAGHYRLALAPGSVSHAEGKIPRPNGGGMIRVQWTKDSDGLHYQLETSAPLHLHLDGKLTGEQDRVVRVEKDYAITLKH